MQGPQILYVDDEEDNLAVFKSVFKNDYCVLTANSGKVALEVLQDQPNIQLIITDQRMPEMSGVELLEHIITQHPDPVRVILTGYSDLNDIVKAINLGRIYHYATKPWLKASLKIVIDKALEHYSLKKVNSDLIESLRLKNKKLTSAIDELEMFLYRSSHDLKGPISSLQGLIYLSKIETDFRNINPYLDKLEKTVNVLENTLRKLTEINVANITEVAFENVDVAELVTRIVHHSQEEINLKNIEIFLQENHGATRINTNPELLQIILECIVENAVSFSKESIRERPYIKIRWSVFDDYFTIDIEDNGNGIDKSVQHRIFDPFFRGNEKSKGNGLGLYIVNKAIHKLNGKIEVMSLLNNGSTFTVKIPV